VKARTEPIRCWLVALIPLFGAILFAYQDAPLNGFHFDDEPNITRQGSIRMQQLSWAGLRHAAINGHLPTRVLPNLSFAVDWWRGGGDPAAFQWTNIVIHCLNALVALLLFCAVLGGRDDSQRNRHALIVAVIAAAFWALHPIQVQAVTYIVQRMAAMATLMVLLAVFSYLRGRRASTRPKAIAWFGLTLLALVGGVLSKENAWIAPVLILLAEYGLNRPGRPLLATRRDRMLWGAAVLVLIYVVVDLSWLHDPFSDWILAGYRRRDFSLGERLLTQPRVVFFHIGQLLWPMPDRFSLEHELAYSTSLLRPISTLPALAGIAVWIALGLWALFRPVWRRIGFWLLWVPATLVIESSAVPLEMIFEHRMHMASIGLAGLLAEGGMRLAGLGRPTRWVVMGLALAMLAGLMAATKIRVPSWRSKLSIYEIAVRNAPTSVRVWTNYGLYLFEDGQIDAASAAYEHVLALDPNSPKALENYGVLLMDQNRLAESSDRLRHALLLYGEKAPASLLNHLGELALAQGELRRAEAMFRDALRRAPWNSAYDWNLAVTYERLEDCESAYRHWLRFLERVEAGESAATVREHLQLRYVATDGDCRRHDSPR
jgi:tetratricopeptide (TPR) repeat protein